MRITRLKVRNFLRIKALDITPSEGTMRIGGKNRQGKSSTIKALEAAFGGARAVPPRPVRDGEVTGEIIAETDDFVVVRTFDGGKHSSLRVLSHEGKQLDEQQSLLDRVFNTYALDPVAIMQADKDKRRDLLIDALGIRERLDQIEEEYTKAYADRRDLGRDAKKAKAKFSDMLPPKPGTPSEVPDAENLSAKRDGIVKKITEAEGTESRLHALSQLVERERKTHAGRVENAKKSLEEAEKAVEMAKGVLEEATNGAAEYERGEEVHQLDEMRKTVDEDLADALQSYRDELKELDEQATKHDAMVEQVRYAKTYASAREEHESARREHEELDRKVKSLAAQRTSLLAQAPFPVDGLAFDEEGALWVNGQPFEQASTAEQIEVCCGIVTALNAELKIIAVRNASLMDDDTTGRLERFCEKHGYDLWLEIVDTANADIVIEDGEVVADNREASDGDQEEDYEEDAGEEEGARQEDDA